MANVQYIPKHLAAKICKNLGKEAIPDAFFVQQQYGCPPALCYRQFGRTFLSYEHKFESPLSKEHFVAHRVHPNSNSQTAHVDQYQSGPQPLYELLFTGSYLLNDVVSVYDGLKAVKIYIK